LTSSVGADKRSKKAIFKTIEAEQTAQEPQDLLATVYHLLGIDYGHEFRDFTGRFRFCTAGGRLRSWCNPS
jgi:hypothetical protein